MFALYAGDATAEEANGAAMFGAVCRELERRSNRLTGQDFWYIDADAGFPLTAAVSIDQAPDLTAGNVVAGTFVMVASDAAVEVEVTQPR
ncbi:hypothetical protein [Tessaracoccus lacteus]|uniref:Uncharacterized protein n=1 Tax=Tessaracoccus lacteus TaxID=3041766 RepID=A0ABY8PUT7_9ACTN|nr:hypothetical protein [Tessaracoccus sp. T21]WGT46209.1 hypothetical protein QH948_08525 [Tessaracoccus sp. T21]